MTCRSLSVLALAGVVSTSSLSAQPWATAVISYEAGVGAATSYNNPAAALGEPSRTVPGWPSGEDPVNPFTPPFLANQLVSIGAGGWLTLQLGQSALNDPGHLFGIDFILFGNNGFTIINGDYSGGGITDGSLFTFDPPGASRVWVSADNVSYFELIAPPGLSAMVDGLFPTDAAGNFQRPVNPALTGADFANQGLAGIRALYDGSAGGTGFDLSWARDGGGNAVSLDAINYLRIDVVSGKLELDGVAVVPEPGTWAVLGLGTLLALAVGQRAGRRQL
ncbi:MAG TPA: hypothetical protein VNO52_09085 [Methylomirabilota bacterium]|nr:hypothetical protein [Methylomirabilota bacterium]